MERGGSGFDEFRRTYTRNIYIYIEREREYVYVYIYIYTDAQAIWRSCRNYRGSRRIDRILALGWSVHGAGSEVQSYSWIQHSIFTILKPQKNYPNSQALFPKSHVEL